VKKLVLIHYLLQLKQQKERIRQSMQELRTLAKFRHDNILSLYGYSLDGPEPCLIYQFMSNGSLEDRLLSKVTHFLIIFIKKPYINRLERNLLIGQENWKYAKVSAAHFTFFIQLRGCL
jgi:serine/threonine protein kinase